MELTEIVHRKGLRLCVLSVASLGATPSFAASPDLIESINTLRGRGCAERAAAKTPLRESSELDAVAREWSEGGRLHDALARAEYRTTNSTSMRISGSKDVKAIANVLDQNYCHEIAEPEFQEVGVFRRGESTWIVLAAPFATPRVADAGVVSRRVLELVNQARARERRCGSKVLPPAPPLTSSAALNQAALAHASDMARNDLFEHKGTDGSTPAVRVERQGFLWRSVGENIAAGAATADVVVAGWLNSPGHCVNIMSPQFSQMGVAYVVDARSKNGIYWSQVFARPR